MGQLQGLPGIWTPEETWPAPETEEAPDGPGRDNSRRPPATGMLPGPAPSGPIVLLVLVADHAERDRLHLRTALGLAALDGRPALQLVACRADTALAHARHLQPDVIVLGSSSAPDWDWLQCALCNRLKDEATVPPKIVLMRDGRTADEPDAARADAIIQSDEPWPDLAGTLHSMLGHREKPGQRREEN